MALNLDDLMHAIIHAWQQATDNRLAEHSSKISAVFEKYDVNRNDMLDYGEFKETMEEIAPGMAEESYLDLFDKCLQVPSPPTPD